MCFFYIPPVSRGQRVLESVRNYASLNGQLEIEVFPPVNKLLCVDPDLLQQILEHSGKNKDTEMSILDVISILNYTQALFN